MIAAVLPWIASAALATAPLVPPPAAADRPLLEKVVSDAAVETETPKPGWSGYLVVLLDAALGSIFDGLRPLGALFRLPSRAAVLAALGFVALVLVGAVGLGIRALVRRRRGTRTAAGTRDPVVASPVETDLTAADWRREADRRLESGDAAGALEALWWFFARALARGDARASWTSGELLKRSGRPELRPFAVELDRFRYGARSPGASDVRDLARRLEGGIGAAWARAGA